MFVHRFRLKMSKYTIYRFFFSNTFLGNLLWNLLQNSHENKFIIQGSSMHFIFFNILAILIRIVNAFARCESDFVGCGAMYTAAIQLAYSIKSSANEWFSCKQVYLCNTVCISFSSMYMRKKKGPIEDP